MSELTHFHANIKAILGQARSQARSAASAAMAKAYRLIGQRIMQEGQHKAQHRTRLVEELPSDLTAELGMGLSYANLYNFRQFYRVFPDQQILYTLCRKLSWCQLRLITRVDSPKYRRILPTEAELTAEIKHEKRLIGGLDYEPLSDRPDTKTP